MEAHPGGFPESHVALGPGPGDGRVCSSDRGRGDRAAVSRSGVRRRRPGRLGPAGGSPVRPPHRRADQVRAIVVVAVALGALPIGVAGSGDRLHAITLIGAVIVVSALAAVLAAWPPATTRAIAAGLFYGMADAAIKAISVRWSSHGAEALISGWTVLVLAATFAGFLALSRRRWGRAARSRRSR